MRRFDLRSLRFGDESEVWRRLPVDVTPFVFGGLEYTVPEATVDAELLAARVGDNMTLTLTFTTTLSGPCQRCLGRADLALSVRGVEYVRHGDSEVGDDEEEGYAANWSLDLETWARDLIAEALPQQLLCREGCRGLCPVCGADLNLDPDHRHGDA